MIKYIGSKRTLLTAIVGAAQVVSEEVFGGIPSGHAGAVPVTVLDLFAGTSRVGHALKAAEFRVIANDHNAYAHVLATCYVQADREAVIREAESVIGDLRTVRGSPGYFTETFCVRSRFFHPKNGERIDAMRERLETMGLSPEVRAVVLTSLMEAADRVDSTTGLQMAYLKDWAARAHNDIELRLPQILPRAKSGKGLALCSDATAAASAHEVDIAYLDPPYNQHSYLGNYHVWESLVLWDKPEVYGIACKRIDCRSRKSEYNSKTRFHEAFATLVDSIRAKAMIVSFNNEGYIAREEMLKLLSSRGHVAVIDVDYKRYVGAQIGIHNLKGERVGTVSHLRNLEHIFVVTPEPLDAERFSQGSSAADTPARVGAAATASKGLFD